MMTHDDLTDDTPTTFPVGWILIAVGLAAWLALGLTIGDPGNGDKPVDAPSPCVDVTVPGSLPALVEPGAVCSHGGGS